MLIHLVFTSKQIKGDDDAIYQKFNKMIISPPEMPVTESFTADIKTNFLSNVPQLNNNQFNGMNLNNGNNEDYVLVPTPIDPTEYEKLKEEDPNFLQTDEFLSYENNKLNYNTTNLTTQDQAFSNLQNTYTNNKAYSDVINSNFKYPEKIEKMINLQEQDYEKYFNNLNKLEYQKVYQSLNQNQVSSIDKEMNNADAMFDYNKVLANLSLNNTGASSFQVNSSDMMIDLPSTKKEVEDMYSKVFNNINLNNSFSFVQKNKDIALIDGKSPMYGKVDSKVKTFTPDIIGIANKNDIHPKDYLKKEDTSAEKEKERINLEMGKRSKEEYPRFRTVLPHEKSDKEEQEYKEKIKQKELSERNDKLENQGTSFIQSLMSSTKRKNLVSAIDHLIAKRNKESKKTIRTDLSNCNKNCDRTCRRVSNLKKESEEMCKMKCHLACSDNAVNNLLK